MYLAEAIKEMEFIRDSIYRIRDRMANFIVVKDKLDFKSNQAAFNDKHNELAELYKKYQQFSITVERSKSASVIQVNNSKLSIADAMTILEVMKNKLSALEYLTFKAECINQTGDIYCLNLEKVYEEVESIRVDIKTLNGEIEYALWQVEV